MPSVSIKLAPGLDTNRTPVLNEAGISATNNVRFKDGLVQKRGGYSAYPGGSISAVPRMICPFIDGNSQLDIAVGATNSLQVINGGSVTDISPVIVRPSATTITNGGGGTYVTPGITCVSGSNTFTITDPNYAIQLGNSVYFEYLTSIGNAVLAGRYAIASIVSTYVYTITAVSVPSITVSSPTYTLGTFTTTAGSHLVQLSLPGQLFFANTIMSFRKVVVGGLTIQGSYAVVSAPSVGNCTIYSPIAATSSASAAHNNGVFPVIYSTSLPSGGTGSIVTTAAYSVTPLTTTDWTGSNYGNTLIACASSTGTIYTWTSPSSYTTAQNIALAPLVSGILVSDAQQQIIGYGAPVGSGQDPNYVVFCDTGNYNTWTAAVGNQAGSYRIPTGSGIVGAALASQQILLWTDIDVWSMSYIGYPLIYGFNKIATGCGLLAQNAWVKIGAAVYWMSQNQFWVYPFGGVPQVLHCPITDSVFGQMSTANIWKIRAGANSQFNEAVWFFPSASGNGENDTYVSFNPVENAWDTGSIARSAWCDQSVAGQPLGADPNTKLIHQHETSTDANGAALPASFTTGYFCLDEGETINFVDWLRPDFKFPNGTGTVQVSILVKDYSGDGATTYGPYSFTAATEFIDVRCRGRFIALQFSSSDTGSMWRIGRVQARYMPDGRR